VRTFAGVCARLPARLLLVGDGPDRPAALELAGELGVGDRVHFLGEQADVKPYFALADLFLFPSESESFGLAAAEAMACETPVVGARAGGLPEVVEDGVSGYLLDIGDDRAMTEAAVGLLLDPARRKEMGHAGRRRVIERFAPESIVPQYELMYGRLMEMAERARAGAV
jgi:N-acetyl-alpha-D-glucosaminyl L-malate synthase BshA